MSGERSESSTLPLKVVDTGPILVLTTAAKPLSPVLSSDSQPGMQALSTSGSLSSAQTFGRLAGKVTSPVIVMAIDVSFLCGLEPSADTPAAPESGASIPIRNLSHRARKIKTSWLSPSNYDEASLGKSISIGDAARLNGLRREATYLSGYYVSCAILVWLGASRLGPPWIDGPNVELPRARMAARLWRTGRDREPTADRNRVNDRTAGLRWHV